MEESYISKFTGEEIDNKLDKIKVQANGSVTIPTNVKSIGSDGIEREMHSSEEIKKISQLKAKDLEPIDLTYYERDQENSCYFSVHLTPEQVELLKESTFIYYHIENKTEGYKSGGIFEIRMVGKNVSFNDGGGVYYTHGEKIEYDSHTGIDSTMLFYYTGKIKGDTNYQMTISYSI